MGTMIRQAQKHRILTEWKAEEEVKAILNSRTRDPPRYSLIIFRDIQEAISLLSATLTEISPHDEKVLENAKLLSIGMC